MFNSRKGISAEEIERATILGRQFENSTKGKPQAQFDLIINNLHKFITNYEEAVHRLWGLIETPKPTGEQGKTCSPRRRQYKAPSNKRRSG